MRISLFKKIFISQLALVVFASGVVALAGYFFMVRLAGDSQNDSLRLASSATALRVAARVARHRETLREIGESSEVAFYAQNYQEPLLAAHFTRYQEQFPFLGYADREGNQIFRLANGHPNESLDNLAEPKLVEAAVAAPNQAILGEVVQDPVLQIQTVRFAYARIDSAAGQFLGLILAGTPLARIISTADSCVSPKNGYCRVVASDGRILGDPEPENIMKQLVIAGQDPGRLFAGAATEPGGRIHHAVVNGEECYFAAALIEGTPWLAMSVLPATQYTAVDVLFRNFAILLFVSLLLLSGISSFFLARRITSPLRKMIQAGGAMAEGDFTPRVAAGKDEIGDLANCFNSMAEKFCLTSSREKLLLAAETSARLSAEQAGRHKDAFLAGISRELRTQTRTVLDLADRLEDGELSGKSRAGITAIKEAGRNLLQLVDGLLDSSSPEKSTPRLIPVPFDLYSLPAELKEKYEPVARAKGLTLVYEEPAGVPTTVFGDKGRIFRALESILDNAIRFTRKGEISLQVRPLGIRVINGRHIIHLRFEIADTGCGIPPEQQTSLLESFRQGTSPAITETGVLGIGLTLSLQLITLMDGQIDLKSEPDKGCTFFVDLDLPVAEEESAAAPETRAGEVGGRQR